MNQIRCQDKVPLITSYMRATEVGDDEMSQSSLLHDRKSNSPIAGEREKRTGW